MWLPASPHYFWHLFKQRTYLALFLVAVLALVLGGSLEGCGGPPEAGSVIQPVSVQVPDGYVGSDACKHCHQQAFQDWMGSHHQLAMLPAADSTVLGNFNTEFLGDDIAVRFFRREGRFFVNALTQDSVYRDMEVLYTFGVEPLQQYLIADTLGRLQALTVAWNSQKDEWMDLYPELKIHHEEWLHWTGNSMTWNSMCADCHSTAYRKNFDPGSGKFESSYAEVNVTCESCHGPGEDHVAAAKAGSEEPGELLLGSGTAQKDLVDACAPCHSRRTQLTKAYNPHDPYLDHYDPALIAPPLYQADGQIEDEVYVYGSFLQSKMHRWGVKCTDCHDPHKAELKMEGNLLCGSCHDPKYDGPEHHFHAAGGGGTQCVDCHMPGKFYMVNDFRHDHSLRVPRPDLGVLYGTSDACTDCHTDRSQAWAAEAIEDHFGPKREAHASEVLLALNNGEPDAAQRAAEFAKDTATNDILRASIIAGLADVNDPVAFLAVNEALNDPSPLVRIAAINALSFIPQEHRIRNISPHLKDDLRAVRLAAARNLADADPSSIPSQEASALADAKMELRVALDANLDMRDGMFAYGLYLERTQMPEKALEAYTKSVEMDPHFNAARLNASVILNQLGRNQEAKRLLQEFIKTEPESAHGHYTMGLLLAELEDMSGAVRSMRRAVKLDSTVSRYWYNLGLAESHTNDKEAAEHAYLQVLRIDPVHLPAYKALTILYWDLGMHSEALTIAELMVQLAPNDQEVQAMLTQLRSGQEQTP